MTTHCTPSRATAIESADSHAFLMKPPGSCARQSVSGEAEVEVAEEVEVVEEEVVAVEEVVAAVAARHLVLPRQRHEVHIFGELELRRRHLPPDPLAQQQVRLGELDREGDPAVHRLVQIHRAVGREDAEALVAL